MLYPSIFGENLFDDFFDDMFKPAKQVRAISQVPSVMRTDIRERDDAFDLHIELPGYTKEDVKAQLKDGYLTISAQTKQDNDEKDENGFEFAYLCPGMNKVQQAAGRVIRSENDRGVVVLCDDRFGEPRTRVLFPLHWRHMKYTGDPDSLRYILEEFWDKS